MWRRCNEAARVGFVVKMIMLGGLKFLGRLNFRGFEVEDVIFEDEADVGREGAAVFLG